MLFPVVVLLRNRGFRCLLINSGLYVYVRVYVRSRVTSRAKLAEIARASGKWPATANSSEML